MRNTVKNLVRDKAYGMDTWLSRAQQRSKVIELIESLRPRKTNVELIRVGPAGDGGYVVPDDLEGLSACLSPGVSTEVNFDLEMARRGVDVYMADASVAGPPIDHPKFHFFPKFLESHASANSFTIDALYQEIVKDKGEVGDLILQMDIEGAEYRVLPTMSDELLKKIRIMVIEFHGLEQIFAKFPFNIIAATFHKLQQYHTIVHSHPNNIFPLTTVSGIDVPPLIEFTFWRNDRGTFSDGGLEFPNKLDADNVARMPPLPLPKLWRPAV